MGKSLTTPRGKVIRDTIHGDVFIHEEFIKVIDTPEFQRLRRIHQLSTAYLVFPSADHTRFSHSIGTYHVMQLLINHFKNIFENANCTISDREINLALGAALLHDIGHGPFSHAFENALPNKKNQKKHEDWTIDIINQRDSTINKVLKDNFDEDFPKDLTDLIRKNREIENNGLNSKDFNEIGLFFVLSSLVSSQLDADRMDYLLRDSFFTGVSYGRFDISRLISSLTITVYENNYYVCIMEKYLPTVEEYLISRYQMHQEVYYHSLKCETELVVEKILFRAYELFQKGALIDDLPEAIVTIFSGNELSVEEYISLDDSIILALFTKWRHGKDPILSRLCSVILERDKYQKLSILDNSSSNINNFKNELQNIFIKHGLQIGDFSKLYFWLETPTPYKLYSSDKDRIYILKEDGTLAELLETTKIINKDIKGEKIMTFFDKKLLQASYLSFDDLNFIEKDVTHLIETYDSRNHIEIEKKYCVKDKEVFEKIKDSLIDLNVYKIESTKQISQEDFYYDTPNKILASSDRTLRIRKKEGSCILTIKTPVSRQQIDSERFEHELHVESSEINENMVYISKYIPELTNESSECLLKNTLIIKNTRQLINIYYNNVKFEIVLDNVTYINKENGQEAYDYQIEIELKSEYLHRINLKGLADYLEKNIPELVPTHDSKYKRGILLTTQ